MRVDDNFLTDLTVYMAATSDHSALFSATNAAGNTPKLFDLHDVISRFNLLTETPLSRQFAASLRRFDPDIDPAVEWAA